jgi:vacuolar-type H+-ATPase subunit I/STV1
LQKHDESIQRQVRFFGRHEQDLDTIADRVEQYFDKATRKLTDLMEARLQQQERDAQNAYEKWQAHFRRLNEDNIYQRILDYMQPFQQLNGQQDTLNRQQQQLSEEIRQTNDRLLRKLDTDTEIQARLLRQLAELNAHLVKAAEPGPIKAALNRVFGKGK